MSRDLIFDLGMNDGSDAAFYLAKGFRVVGVEASAELCADVVDRLRTHVASGQLSIENVAVTEANAPVAFYPNEKNVWGTTRPGWVERNTKLTHASEAPIMVEGVTLDRLIVKYGVPYYLKIDIEGADLAALMGLRGQERLPQFTSIESDKVSWDALLQEFDVLAELGYVRYKVVPQQWVPLQRMPKPAREGIYVPWRFHLGDSGMFGEEAPGAWLTRDQALRRYRQIFRRYKHFGDRGIIAPPGAAGAATRRYLAGWYDTHAGR